MKKVIFCIGAMLIAATGFSQNVSEIDQISMNNDVDVNQLSTGVYYNFSDVDQQGNMNFVDVDQIGGNSSVVVQDHWGYQDRATVYQDGGNGSKGYGPASMQISEIYQSNEQNKANVHQIGEGNKSFVNQDNTLNNGIMPIMGNMALIDQEGRDNLSDVNQDGDANWAKTDQFGEGNVSITEQISLDITAPISLTNYLQGSLVDQSGDYNYANVYQNGDNNFSNITQSGGVVPADPLDLWTNEAWVIQNGDLNISNIDQSSAPMHDADNYAIVNQTNTIGSLGGNISNVLQNGCNTATVTQVNGTLIP
jgi:hypothetical protein